MLSLKALLLVSVSCLAHLAAASPLDHPGLEVRQEICVPGSKGGDKATIGDLCTKCNVNNCRKVAGQPPCC
ncbi:hypothetical protein MGG_17582 [Pyricularia oryzae 70-15]|uniref:Uncharacterized protein n=3 Tax=Pyricularia oryzae TaxID=318829 RepID=G4NFX4_PYRO7|nr:uncharacterized protein MGG_17582 [Pyricularia oryzae 70-15]ELQ41050.1 hypothetical protein OOU_Y34scaffold00306g4 [Pyricularia oryzae Y34]KAI6321758.1 hypothetical protein MCOR34_002527 [Pyricularia oryzae]EHA46931.1 hypothetical protein MGG_17582 [Pyricularia oryzae 70-15]KAI6464057.1 hypothetical protein MCOR17_005476 [Pyricularia oryzae]KAI6482518.1 hypothetical protein MCOR13_010484 [Pyricularia oryzae]